MSTADMIGIDADARRQLMDFGYDSMGQIGRAGDRTARNLMGGNEAAMGQLGSAGMDIRNRIGADRSSALSSLLDSNNAALADLGRADAETRGQALDANRMAMDRLDRQQDLYRQDYGNMMGQGLMGLLTLGREGSGAMRTGMGDFYSNLDRGATNFGQYLDAARQGFGQSSSDIRGIGDRMSRDYGSSLGSLTGLASQIGSGMRDANQTGVDFANNFLQRYMPTPEEEYRRANRLGAMRAADRESAMARSPYVQNYNAYRDRVRAAERRMPVMR
jgi:hypothetical protein